MDHRSGKLMTIHKPVHLKDGIDRLYLTRKEGGRGTGNIEHCEDASIRGHEEYIKKIKEELIATPNDTHINKNPS